MRIKEIGTVIAAGVLSLGALVVIEFQGKLPVSDDTQPEIVEAAPAFEDNSALLEPSVPAPTAEPPQETEGGVPGSGEVFESTGGSAPVPVPVDAEGNPIKTPIEEPAPEFSEIDETPVEQSPAADPDGSSLAGIEMEPEEEDNSEADSFAEAIAAATGGTGGTEAASETPAPPGEEAVEGAEPASIIEETATGFWLREAKLNDVFQHLAQLGNYQYFHNAELEGPTFVVTGQLMDDDPIVQMEELALMYGVTIHKKGNTVYALTAPQLSQLPTEPFRYQLKYLRPGDIEQIKLILQPFLTPGSGIIEFESKTNTLIVMDNARKLEALSLFLDQIDQPKQQIAIETRILRVTSNSENRIGVDWSNILGENGLEFNAATSLNALFNLPEIDQVTRIITTTGTGNSIGVVNNNQTFTKDQEKAYQAIDNNLVLAPLQLNAVLRALHAGGLAEQESSPTLIAEDNEEGLISIIDRIPIITATVTETDAGTNITEEVRYSIDEADPVGDPATTREVGVSVAVTPTILPDNTIRMSLRPRSAQVTEFVESPGGNFYPRVNESTVTTTARVPNGHSLLIGGFYEEITGDETNKVPILGDLPAVHLLFKSSERTKAVTSLVFIVTPKLYHPTNQFENDLMAHELHDSHVLPTDHEYPDRFNPGSNYKTNMKDSVNNLFKRYEPTPPSNLLHPEHPYNLPQAKPIHGKDGEAPVPTFSDPSVEVRPVNGDRRQGGLLGKMFGGNKAHKTR